MGYVVVAMGYVVVAKGYVVVAMRYVVVAMGFVVVVRGMWWWLWGQVVVAMGRQTNRALDASCRSIKIPVGKIPRGNSSSSVSGLF